MVDTITRNSVPAAPVADLLLVTELEADVEITTVMHGQLHGSGHVITYRPARNRAGTLRLLFPSSAAAWAAVAILSTSHTYTYATTAGGLGMTFAVRPGALRPRAAGDGMPEWLLDVPFQAV